MIAWQGNLEYKAGTRTEIKDAVIDAYQRTDEVDVNWK